MIQARLNYLEQLLEEIRDGYTSALDDALGDMKECGCHDFDDFLDGRGSANVGITKTDSIIIEVGQGRTARQQLLEAVVTIILKLQNLDT